MPLPKTIFKTLTAGFSEVLSPRHCIVCEEYISDADRKFEFICDSCFHSIPYAESPEILLNNILENYAGDELCINNAYALLRLKDNDDWMKLIYGLKYEGFSRIGYEFGKELGRIIQSYGHPEYSGIVPIPVHKARLRERGFNQSLYIARGVSEILSVPVADDIIERAVYTQTQTVLSAEERKINVEGAFRMTASNSAVEGKTYLLVDDVITTGSTMNRCALCLLEAGVREIHVAAVASAR